MSSSSILNVCAAILLFCTSSRGFQEGAPIGLQRGHKSSNIYAVSEVVINPHANIESLHRLGRRQDTATTLKNNLLLNKTIGVGGIDYFVFPSSELQGPQFSGLSVVPPWQSQGSIPSKNFVHQELKRQAERKFYVTLNVCSQPSPTGKSPPGPPPSLVLWISLNNEDNKTPGPRYTGSHQTSPNPTVGGRAFYEDFKTGDTYIGVSAPGSMDGFSGQWTYQLTVSNQDYYSGFLNWNSLNFLDADSDSTFFVTDGLTKGARNDTGLSQRWINTGGPFGVFVYDANDPMMAGINHSFCGLANYAVAKGNLRGLNTSNSETGIRQFRDIAPYQQFFVGNLKPSTDYKAALALTANYSLDTNTQTPAGGGSVWKSIDFRTKSGDTNCQLIYNLTFCDDVAYSVPSNPGYRNNMTGLAANYDNYTNGTLWQLFRNSLDQIPCNTSADAKYSLARTCDDCAAAYKKWVCAVSIPRCGDVSSSASFMRLRNTQDGSGNFGNNTKPDPANPLIADPANSRSRNQQLASYVNLTGPYKEVLPCDSLCYDLVQSCPSALGFACPDSGKGLEWSYGSIEAGKSLTTTDGYPVCNLPGAIYGASDSSKAIPSFSFIAIVVAIVVLENA